MDKCPGLIGGLNDPTTSCTIKSPIDEIVNGTMSVLPGSNPIGQWGSGVASVASSVVASATSGIASQASSVAVGASSVAASVSNVASSALGVATSAASISIPSISLPLYQAPTSASSQHSQTHTRSGASTKVAAASSAASEVVSSSVITSGGQVFTSIVTVHASTLIYKTVSVTAGQVLPTGSSVSSSTPAAISGYSYAGCYADQESSRALSGVAFADVGKGAVSSSACVEYCEEKGYSVAGTEYGGQCFCGQNLPSQTVDASKCAMACEGDANEICGGSLALSVYSKSGASKEKRKSRHLHRHVQRN